MLKRRQTAEVESTETCVRLYLVGVVKSSETECTTESPRYRSSLCNGTASDPLGFIKTNMFPLNIDTYKNPSPCNTQRQ